ncbi:hypothetical protein [Krasilnikovia sp. M28-CT-15]|uniref:hypothetical protein n=1 Tax=Krasilnikovia sp. M28-CT-15 TaxID=3373540 RepID=UPI00399C6CCA
MTTGVPLAPRVSGGELPPWSRADVAALLELHAAAGVLIDTRRTYDAVRRFR